MTEVVAGHAQGEGRPPAPGVAVPPPDGLAGLLLDIDDTLTTTMAAMHRAAATATSTVWPDVTADRAGEAGVRYRVDPGGHFRAYTRGEHDATTMRARRVQDLAAWLGLEGRCDDDAVRRWRAVFDPGLLDGIEVFDDVEPVLRRCEEAGVPVALLTNAPGDITDDKLARCGLGAMLEGRPVQIVTKDTLGRGKPDPAVFHHACDLLGLRPETVAYVGDEVDVDPVAALDAGLGAAWLRRPGYPVSEEDRQLAAGRGLAPFERLDEAVDALLGTATSGFGSDAAAR